MDSEVSDKAASPLSVSSPSSAREQVSLSAISFMACGLHGIGVGEEIHLYRLGLRYSPRPSRCLSQGISAIPALVEHDGYGKQEIESYLNKLGVANEDVEAFVYPLFYLFISAFAVSCAKDPGFVPFVLNEFRESWADVSGVGVLDIQEHFSFLPEFFFDDVQKFLLLGHYSLNRGTLRYKFLSMRVKDLDPSVDPLGVAQKGI